MTKRPSIIRRLLGRITGRKASPPKPDAAPAKPERRKRRTESSFEPLEGRIAPAILLSPSTVQYKDTQGDLVTVKFSKAIFTPGSGLDATLDRVFKFDTGNVRSGGNTDTAQVLQTLDLTGITTSIFEQGKSIANGVSISITAEPLNGLGDGLVDVGFIKATQSAINGITLGKILIEGDLGRIEAGTALKALGVQSLIVNSLGALGTTTQGAGGSLTSSIFSGFGSLVVNADVKDVIFKIEDGNVINGKILAGNLGSLSIGGKLTATANLAVVDAGSFAVDGDIGKVKVGTLPTDGIYGGSSQGSGRIHAVGKIGAITMNGDIRGSAGKDSGQIAGDKGIGDVSLQFSLFAGSGEGSGRIVASGGSIGKVSLLAIRAESAVNGGAAGKNAGSISASTGIGGLELTGGSVDGKILGGAGEGSGSVTTSTGNITKVSMGGALLGGAGLRSGRIFAGGDIGTAIVGAISGGVGVESGVLRVADDFGVVTVASLTGGTGNESGVIRAGDNIKSVVVQGVITGGGGTESGAVRANDLTSLLVKNAGNTENGIIAGTGIRSGYVGVNASAGKIVVQGSLDGSTASARESAGSISIGADVASISISKSLMGGVAEANGSIVVNGKVRTITIGGSLSGGSANFTGGISVAGAVDSISVAENITGGAGFYSGAITVGSDFAKPGGLKSLVVGGNVSGGSGVNSGFISAGGVIGKATIGDAAGSLGDAIKGGSGGSSGGIYSALGLGTVKIFGNLAGGDGFASGAIRAGGIAKSITILGSISGAVGAESGSVRVADGDLVVGKLVKLRAGAIIGGAGDDSGQIAADGAIGSVSLSQVNGNSGARSGSILAGFGNLAAEEGSVKLGGISSLRISASLQAASGGESGSVIASGTLTSMTVGGSLSGSTISAGRVIGSLTAGSLQGVEIRAVGQAAPRTSDLAIAKLTVRGSVSGSEVLAGYDRYGNGINGDAQIGAVLVTSDWMGSSMAAGVLDVDGDGFGSADDAAISGGNDRIISKIASVVIGGNVTGKADASQVGFVAQQIDSMSIAGTKVALTPAKNTIVLTTTLNEITIREVA